MKRPHRELKVRAVWREENRGADNVRLDDFCRDCTTPSRFACFVNNQRAKDQRDSGVPETHSVWQMKHYSAF